jgi:hypothetical protein
MTFKGWPLVPCGDELVALSAVGEVMQPRLSSAATAPSPSTSSSAPTYAKESPPPLPPKPSKPSTIALHRPDTTSIDSHSDDTSPRTRMHAGEATSMDFALALLSSVGVSVADPDFAPLALRGHMLPLTGRGITEALASLRPGWHQHISTEGCAALLELVARDAGDLSEATLKALADLPVFLFGK